MVRNHYLLLGIPPDASQRQIRNVYRDLAKRFHPDRNKAQKPLRNCSVRSTMPTVSSLTQSKEHATTSS